MDIRSLQSLLARPLDIPMRDAMQPGPHSRSIFAEAMKAIEAFNLGAPTRSWAEVRVNGTAVAKFSDDGVTMFNIATAKLVRGLTGEGSGAQLAEARARQVAEAVGGEVVWVKPPQPTAPSPSALEAQLYANV